MANIKGYDMGGGTGNAARSGYYVAQVKKPAITEDKSKKYTGTGYNYGTTSTAADTGAYTGGGNSYADYLAQIEARQREAIDKANAAIDEQTKVAEAKYNEQKKSVERDYQDLKNQNSVKWAKGLRNLKEVLANQGRLDGGAGRMERTTLDNNFSNNETKIDLERESELQAISNAIAELIANAGAAKAQNEITMAGNSMSSLLYGLQNGLGNYSYSPATSDYYAQAQNAVNQPYTFQNAVSDGAFANPTTAAILKALEDQWANASSGYYAGGGGTGNFSR